MTDAQEQALLEIRKIALANFDGFVMAARVSAEDSPRDASDYRFCNVGPMSDCLGLAWMVQNDLRHQWNSKEGQQ